MPQLQQIVNVIDFANRLTRISCGREQLVRIECATLDVLSLFLDILSETSIYSRLKASTRG